LGQGREWRGVVLVLQDEKSFRDWLYKRVNLLNTIKLYIQNGYVGKYCVRYISTQ
jgi:hypothetical protein